jgi:predicted nucleotidyltransferase
MGIKTTGKTRKVTERRAAYRVAPLSPVRASLADALFSNTQQRVLGFLFGQPERSFYATELIGLVNAGSGGVQRELTRLEQSGLVAVHRVGTQKHYQANKASPLFEELCGIARKTSGLAEPLRKALEPLTSKITAAFVYGSVAKKQDTAASDIDLMVVSDSVTHGDIYSALEPLVTKLGRPVNPTVYSKQELAHNLKTRNSFVTRVLEQPKIWIIGTDNDLAA